MDRTKIRQIGRYELLDVIGQGGMGIVYRAVDASIGRTVAIKMLHGAYAEDKDLLARFHREVRFTANLQHKNIVTVYALDDFEGFPYMVMEHLEGQSMAEMITSRRPLHLVEKIGLICQVCEGLQYAHERSVIHRDIKPANILVLKDGTAKIVDFGIARVGMNKSITRTGQVIGSVHYMSPEQISGASVDGRTDIYSAAVTLYQFLAGELPFKGGETDPHSTLVKILHDPVPSLGRYLTDYPIALDEILGKAMAKNPEERYQTAEDFGYDLSRLQESLKRGMTEKYLSQAKTAIDQKDWELARQQLQEVLKFERRNNEATELLRLVRQEIQRQQRSVQIAQLRSQAQVALTGLQYEEALECVEQALRLDPDEPELIALSTSIKAQVARARELAEALRRGQAALYAGDLNEAKIAVREALNIEQSHTEARALEVLINKELEERARRANFQVFVEEARREISNRNFLSALQSLQRAQAIDPGDSNIRELLSWAARGHEQEKLRSELQKCTNEIGQLLGENRYAEALEICQASLQRFPAEPSLQKLHQLASHQYDVVQRRRAVDEASVEARRLAEADKNDEAIEVLERALRSFPNEPNLETLLALTRADSDQKRLEKEERERQQEAFVAEQNSTGTPTDKHQQDLEQLKALQEGLARKLPISKLRILAGRVADAARSLPLNAQESTQYSAALAEFKLRSTKWEHDCEDLDEIGRSICEAKGSADADSLLDRARSIAEQHGKDEEIRGRYAKIREFAEAFKTRREAVCKQVSDLLSSMQGNQNLESLVATEGQVLEVSARWLEDAFIRSLANQASAHVEDARRRKEQILQELAQLTESLLAARSAGQIRLLEEQASMVSVDFDDPEIEKAIHNLHRIAKGNLGRIEAVVSQLRDLSARVAAAETLASVESCDALAHRLASEDSDSEEANDLLRRIRHSVEERKKEYRRIEIALERLLESSTKATGPAELDLILARRRDVLKKYPDDPHFKDLEIRLEKSVNDRRAHLTEAALPDELPKIDEILDETVGSGEVSGTQGPFQADQQVSTSLHVQSERHVTVLKVIFFGAVLGGIIAVAAFFGTSRTITIRTNPTAVNATVDGQACRTPCTLKLRAGKHELLATHSGFEPLHQTVTVPWSGADPPLYTMSAISKEGDRVATVPLSTTEPHRSNLLIDTKLPDVSVFVDGRLEGHTTSNGKLAIITVDGAHELRVEKEGYKATGSKIINVRPDANARVPFTLIADSSAKPIVAATLPNHPAPAAINRTGTAAPVVTAPVPPPPVPVTKLTANPGKVLEGQPVTLTWQTENATDVTIEGVGTVGSSGSKQLNLDRSTTFRLVAKGPGGSANESLTVDVIAATKATLPSPADADRQGIKLALHRYKEAYESESLDEMKEAWPDISKEQQKSLREAFKFNAIRLELICEEEKIKISGDEAMADCRQASTFTLNGKKQPEQVGLLRIGLRKQGGTWKVASVAVH